MIAIARRVFGVCMVLAGMLCLCWPAAGVWRLNLIDFAADYKDRQAYADHVRAKPSTREAKPLLPPKDYPATGLDQYVKEKAGNRLVEVSDPAWDALYQRTLQSRRYLHLPANTEPLAQMAQATGRTVFYVRLPERYPVLLLAALHSTSSALIVRDIPWGMTHPLAWLTPWLIGAGLLIYIFLPRPRRRENEARYSLFRSQIGPDILVVFLSGAFLVLPIFIVAQFSNYPDPLSMEGGWLVLTLICWFIALCAGSNMAVSAWYEGLCFQLTPTGIRKINLFKRREYAFDQMIEVRPKVFRTVKWLRTLAWLVVLFNPRLAGPVILASRTSVPAVEIPCRDGGNLGIFIKHLIGWDMLEQAILNAGITFSEEWNPTPKGRR